ncbi:MAG: hypothetical protein ACXWKY_13410 [Caulobacteraceae bacterium]
MTSTARTILAGLTAAGSLILASPGHTQGAGSAPIGKPTSTTPYPVGPTPRLADGHPDLSGFWKPVKEKGKPGGNMGKDYPGFQLPFTPEGEKIHQFNLTKVVDPEAVCILGGIPRHNASGLPFEILATPSRTAFLYLYTTHRLIPVDGRPVDPDPDPRFFGNPVGAWEGDTFVVRTNGLRDSADGKIWLDENGDPTSDKTTVLERWTRPDSNTIHLEMTINDPKYYREPIHFQRTWTRGLPGEGLTEYACNETSTGQDTIGPGPGYIGPDGNRGYPPGSVLPKTPPGPDAYDK